MNRRSARRHVSAGAILALALWMGGLPAAAADEPLPDTPTAAASASSAVGGDSAADATPAPEPSPSVEATTAVEPTEPAPSTDPTPSTEATPSPEPTPTGDQPTKGAEPAPAPRPIPTVGPHTSTSTRGHAPDTQTLAPTITVGDFDCRSLTTTVTLDNTGSAGSTTFRISVLRWTPSGDEGQAAYDTTVAAHAVGSVTVALFPDAYSIVSVRAGLTHVEKRGACGAASMDPRATIGTFDCAKGSVPVTLDNSRSAVSVEFGVALWYAGWDHYTEGDMHSVAAGESTVVLVHFRLTSVTRVVVFLPDGLDTEADQGVELARADSPLCGLVTVSDVECSTMTFTVTLHDALIVGDGQRTFVVTSTRYPKVPTAYHRTVQVASGAYVTLRVPVSTLAGGRIRVVEAWAPEVRYEEAVDAHCPAGSGSANDADSAPVAAESLAATGADGQPRLAIGGLLVLTLGGVLLRVGREPRA